jgi:hypothetical protein
MIDLETLGTKPGSVILSIGAVAFAPGQVEDHWATFGSGPISVKASRDASLTIDEDTLAWWLGQPEEPRALLKKALANEAVAPWNAFIDFAGWLPVGARVWGNGANFDNVLLRAAMGAVGVACLWPYYADHCYRTVKNLFPQVPKPKFQGVKHDALADALHQTRHLQAILARIIVTEVR